ncbi:hypothetical protein GCM10010425_66620 [Streptomyces spororaveus]|uniref:Uncharacterized protein n=1 Tax=Streptomyces spororaveus TaxID=284039 RepID=A0ABQ3TMG0_9ACTN|nr:hypothetical protein Sspor_70930 [Streptomyces spororaveus]
MGGGRRRHGGRHGQQGGTEGQTSVHEQGHDAPRWGAYGSGGMSLRKIIGRIGRRYERERANEVRQFRHPGGVPGCAVPRHPPGAPSNLKV